MTKRNMILLDIDYITKDDKPVIRLFGKVKGKSNDIIALDDSFVPYLYIMPNGDIDDCINDLKELESAVRKGDNYRFAIICTDSRRDDPFIYPQRNNPKDPYAVFMTLKDLLRFTTRASMGIQFTIKYSSKNSRLETTLQGKKAYSENDLMQLLEIYAKLKDAKLAR